MVLSNVKNVFQDMIWLMVYARNGVWTIIVMNVLLVVIIVDSVMLVMSWVMVNVCRIWLVIILQNRVILRLIVILLLMEILLRLIRLIILLLQIVQLITRQIATQLKPIPLPTLQLTAPQTITQQLILQQPIQQPTIPLLIPQHKLSAHAKSAPKNIIYHQISPVYHVPLQTLTVSLAPWLHQKIVHNVHQITTSQKLLLA